MSIILTIIFFCVSLSAQSILKKSVTMQHTPSAVYQYSDAGTGNVHQNKVNAIFQAAKKDLLQVIQIQVAYNTKHMYCVKCKLKPVIGNNESFLSLTCHLMSSGPQSAGGEGESSPG